MKRTIIFILINILFIGGLIAQHDSIRGVHKGILSGTLTLPVGYLLSEKASAVYIAGNLEYYTDNKISVRGDAAFFIQGAGTDRLIKQNDFIWFGAFYHVQTHSNFDPLIGFQPGISYTQMIARDIYANPLSYNDPAVICPHASVIIGFNYYAEKWFHILVNVRYSAGEYLSKSNDPGVLADMNNISELSFSFGLGWNLDLIK